MTNDTSGKNGLVVYAPNQLDLTTHVKRLGTPICDLNPETRVVSNEGIYAGGFCKLKFDESRIWGCAYIRYLTEVREVEPTRPGMLEQMMGRVFGEQQQPIVNNSSDVTHEDRRYSQQWRVDTNNLILFSYDSAGERFRPGKFPLELKTEVVTRMNVLVSNELVESLLAPLSEPIIQVYLAIVKH